MPTAARSIALVRVIARPVRLAWRELRTTACGVADELFPDALDAARRAGEFEGWAVDGPEAYCPRCGASAGPGAFALGRCPHCRHEPIPWLRLTRLGAYQDPLDEWVRRMKFQGQWRWAHWFGRRLAEAVGEPVAGGPPVVCPVPMNRWRRWHRGYDQAVMMAEALAAARGWPCRALLRRTRYTEPQIDVPPSAREKNASVSLALRVRRPNAEQVLLVDDIKTTGATLKVCTRLLKRAGVRRVYVAVAAVADPKHRDFKAV